MGSIGIGGASALYFGGLIGPLAAFVAIGVSGVILLYGIATRTDKAGVDSIKFTEIKRE